MELNKKLQELRKQKGLTQEELAERLYVSRTAISKWESGRGYPNIESLKAIATFFSLTVDELLSSDEILTIAAEEQKRTEKHFLDLVFGLLDVCMALVLFLPLFAVQTDGAVRSVSLLALYGVSPWLKVLYLVLVIGMAIFGILTLSLQNCRARAWLHSKAKISLALGMMLVVLLMISRQPYAAVFAFALLAIKALMLIKRA